MYPHADYERVIQRIGEHIHCEGNGVLGRMGQDFGEPKSRWGGCVMCDVILQAL